METVMFSEILKNREHSTQLVSESWSYTLSHWYVGRLFLNNLYLYIRGDHSMAHEPHVAHTCNCCLRTKYFIWFCSTNTNSSSHSVFFFIFVFTFF
jgi:hypothetical protein